MKKLLLGSFMLLALGTTAFAGMHHRLNNLGDGYHYNHSSSRRHNCHNRSVESREAQISIDEKRLEVRRELLNENPDWNKIQRLNDEISLERSKYRTENMKQRFEEDRRNIAR